MTKHDLVLKGGLVVDGTGAPGLIGDVAVRGDAIEAIGPSLTGRRELDCRGLVVAPGFIDTHSHSDLRVLVEPLLPMKLRQGITLEVLGQDGISVAPIHAPDVSEARRTLSGLLGDPDRTWRWERVADYLDALADAEPAVSLAYLVPHGTLRTYVMGAEARPPTADELGRMGAELQRGIDEGALGMSTGLIYPPCCYADTDELVALGRVLAPAKAPIVVHMRSESDRIEGALDEMLSVGERAGCPIHVSHLKIAGRQNFALAPKLVERFERALRDGLTVTADQYPYTAGSTMLGAILPPWAHDGGPRATLARLRDPEARQRMRAQMEDAAPQVWDSFWKWTGPEGIVISDVPSGRRPELLGKTILEAARLSGREHEAIEFAFDLLRDEEMGVGMISHSQDEPCVRAFMRLPFVNGGTDALLGGRPHPRAFGTYPRFLGRYVRDERIVPLEEMIRKLTSQAARAMNLRGVGEIRPGFAADLVVFDADRVRDRATFAEPMATPEGITHVVVRGQLALEAGEPTGIRAGRVVRRTEA